MRLTLRTLLAYLDDALDPAQTKLIGQKVAESESAQELIARIRQVTRRRRLTTPQDAGPSGRIDPNTIAEYLDNAVTPEQQADIEQICLASDVHLAEVAACHQILTLVLGEPALVPPPAKQRMYGLVKGPEAIPFRKPPAQSQREYDLIHESRDTDETLRLGLPAYGRKANWGQRLLLVFGALVVLALLGFAVVQVMNPSGPTAPQVPVAQGPEKVKEIVETITPQGGKTPPVDVKDDPKNKSPEKDTKSPPEKTKERPAPEAKGKAPVPGPDFPVIPLQNASTRQVLIGNYVPPNTKEISILLQSQAGQGDWRRIGLKKPEVFSARPLVSLPASRSAVELKKGVQLVLWGYIPELWPDPPLLESVVIVNYNDTPGVDLDLTYRRGRILLRNANDDRPARVRVRFENPTIPEDNDFFDFSLQNKGTEILLDRWTYGVYEPFYRDPKNSKREGPTTQMVVLCLAGEAYLRYHDFSPLKLESKPGPALVAWSSQAGLGTRRTLDKLPEFISTSPAWPTKISESDRKQLNHARLEMLRARDELGSDLSVKEVDVALKEAVTAPKDASKRALAVRCFGALDDLSSLVDALDQENFDDVRHEAVKTLQLWIGSSRNAEYKLYAFLKGKYKLAEAANIMELLHNSYYTPEVRGKPETYDTLIEYLDNDLMPIRELAAWHLYRLAPQGQVIGYSASAPRETRRLIQAEWRKLIPPGKLPPTAK